MEFAIIAPVLILLVLGGFAILYGTTRKADLERATAAGVVVAQDGGNPDAIRDRVRAAQHYFLAADVTITSDVSDDDGATWTGGPCRPGSIVRVVATVESDRYEIATPIGGIGGATYAETRGSCAGTGSAVDPGGGSGGMGSGTALFLELNERRTSAPLAYDATAEANARACAESMAAADTVIACAPLRGAGPNASTVADAWATYYRSVVDSGTVGGCWLVYGPDGTTGYAACSLS